MTYEEYKQLRGQGTAHDEIAEREGNIQRGLFGEILPTAGAIGGSILGGSIGIPHIGAGVGGAIGEAVQQTIERVTGEREQFDLPQIGISGVTSGVVSKGVQVAGKAAAKVVKPILPSKEAVVGFLGKMSGYAPDLVEKLLERTPQTQKAFTGGVKELNDVLLRTARGVQKFAAKTLQESKETVSHLYKQAGDDPKIIQALFTPVKAFVSNIEKTLDESFKIGVKKGKLLFARETTPSNIVTGADQTAIQEAYNWINTLVKNPSIKQIDSVFERIISLMKKTPDGSPTGGETKLILQKMMDETVDWMNTLGFKPYTDYSNFLKKNLSKRVMIEEAKDLFGRTAHPAKEEITRMTTKVLQIYNAAKLGRRELVEQVGALKEVGEDITGAVAGAILKVGDTSVRGIPLSKISAVTNLIRQVPQKVLKNFVETGKVVDDSRLIRAIQQILGKSTKAILLEIVNVLEEKERR